MRDVVVVGGGIVGLATAHALAERNEGLAITLVEKEAGLAQHQTGRNSGVIHSGIYYKPGSLKAQLGVAGNRAMVAFCQEYGIAHEITGKLIAATDAEQAARLDSLADRGRANGIEVTRLSKEAAAEHEPHLRCEAALWVPSTGIVDYGAVCETLAKRLADHGAEVHTDRPVTGIRRQRGGWIVQTAQGPVEARRLVTCGGLQSDRLVRMAGADPGAKIIPFRGEYHDVVPERRHLVKGLIYPVPDLRFPFLGVHATRGIHGDVHAGPNAVLAFAREGYDWRTWSRRDLTETLRYRGFWKMARRHWRYGLSEMHRSLRFKLFVASIRELIPEFRAQDFTRAPAGVRAQAVDPGGELLDDFALVRQEDAVHVVNAPSPAATASLEIGRAIAADLMDGRR